MRAREADRLAATTTQHEAPAGLGASDGRADHPRGWRLPRVQVLPESIQTFDAAADQLEPSIRCPLQPHQIQILQASLAQQWQLIAAGGHELPADTAFLDSVAFHHTFHRSPRVSRGQSRHYTFAHRSLQFSILLQLTLAVQLHFLASGVRTRGRSRGPSVPQKPRNPAAFPSAHSRHPDSADVVVLPDGRLRFPAS